MLEIFAVWRLYKRNITDEHMRGRSGSGVIWYTIAIWVTCELLGFIIGGSTCRVLGWPFRLAYLWNFAFVFALLLSQVTRAIA